jgi:hypothetical protein
MRKEVTTLIGTVLVSVLAGCASTHPVPPLNLATRDLATKDLATKDLAANLPDIAAEYVTTRRHIHNEKTQVIEKGKAEPEESMVSWHFFRQQNRIDIDNITARTGEVWLRDGKTLIMRQLFHDDRKGVEYLTDDFAVLGMKPSWDRQALLLDPHTLQQLPETGAYWLDGYPVRSYRGKVDGQQLEIIWRVDNNIPYSITRLHDDEKEITRLQASYPLSQSPWQYNNGEDYELMDYTDLGDRERDPFVIKIQSQLPGGDVHHH